jgi:predicted permease
VAVVAVALSNETRGATVTNPPLWAAACGIAGAVLAFVAAAMARRTGPAFAGVSAGLAILAELAWTGTEGGEHWLAYALELGSMLCLVVSGMLDAARPRIVAGWLGLAGVIAAITWAVQGSLLRRSVFLAVAGGAAVALALLLDRLRPRASAR